MPGSQSVAAALRLWAPSHQTRFPFTGECFIRVTFNAQMCLCLQNVIYLSGSKYRLYIHTRARTVTYVRTPDFCVVCVDILHENEDFTVTMTTVSVGSFP